MSTMVIQAVNLGVSFGGVHALKNVSLTLEPGELRCLIGPNGAGKSTFFKLLTGQYRPTRGTVSICGKSSEGLQPHEIAQLGVGIKTQVPSVFDGLTVYENVWLAARRVFPQSKVDDAVDDALDLTGLADLADCPVGLLSHGQRQWVELAMVVAPRPTLVLLDEPAAGMSDDEVARTVKLIKAINERCAIVVVEHDMEFIRAIAKTVTVFNRGEVLIEATVDQVLADERVRDVYLGRDLAERSH